MLISTPAYKCIACGTRTRTRTTRGREEMLCTSPCVPGRVIAYAYYVYSNIAYKVYIVHILVGFVCAQVFAISVRQTKARCSNANVAQHAKYWSGNYINGAAVVVARRACRTFMPFALVGPLKLSLWSPRSFANNNV